MDETAKKRRQGDTLLSPSDPDFDSTHVRGFDAILGGGLARGALVVLAGPPGSGKTILATEMAFRVATHGGHALVFSAFSEPSNKLLTHIRSLTYYQHEEVGRGIEFLNIQQFLKEGLEETIEEVVRMVRQRHATFVVLDSFAGVRDVAGSAFEGRKFVYELGNRLNLLGATTIITSEANAHESYFFPEATTADVIVNLRYDTYGVRARRNIEIIKVRGAEPLIGLHAMVIDQHGVWIIPRIESRALLAVETNTPASTRPAASPSARVSTGLPALDDRLGGGLIPSTTTLVVGMPGTGKTTLGLHFALAGVRAQEPTLFLSLRGSISQLLLHASAFSWGQELAAAHEAERLHLVSLLPIEMRADVVAEQLISLLDAHQIRRLILDGSSELERTISANGYQDRMHDFCAALLHVIRWHGTTALFLRDTPEEPQQAHMPANGPISMLVENVICLRQEMRENQQVRSLTIPQTRYSAHAMRSINFTIAVPQGMQLTGTESPSSPKHTRRGAGAGSVER